MVLLAQLRASATGILGRQAQFADTLARFSEAAHAFGPRIVQLEVLRRTVQHARRMRCVGTVRAVLSMTQPMAAFDEGVSTAEGTREDPEAQPVSTVNEHGIAEAAPIDDYHPDIVRPIGHLRVSGPRARLTIEFQGRAWTEEDINGALSRRRSVLNKIDPLFFQVDNLWEVLSGATGESDDRTETYLRALLADMMAANKTLTGAVSDPADGAAAAVRVSQYVRAKGGKDWRGLTFTLEGLHGLADRELRRAARDDRLYVEGVNRVLRHEADKDDLVELGSTVGMVVLGLLCAPLGTVAATIVTSSAGLALSVRDHLEVHEKLQTYRSTLTPEELLKWQDIQAAQLSATLGSLFSVLDVAQLGGAVREIVSAVRLLPAVAERAGASLIAREAFAAVRRQTLDNLSEQMLRLAVKNAVHELATSTILNEVISRVLAPAMSQWAQEQGERHGTVESDQRAELDRLIAELEALPR